MDQEQKRGTHNDIIIKQTLQVISAIQIESNLRGRDMRAGFIRGWGCKCHET